MSIYKSLRFALVRPLPRSFVHALQQHPEAIDWQKAHDQHERYTELLKEILPRVLIVPADEKHPDCCFIEDTALVLGNDVIITRIGNASRRQESRDVAQAFAALAQEFSAFRIHELKAPATLDGGDVLQMGEHVFVGLSERSNSYAVEQLRALLPNSQVVGIPVSGGLHLKSLLSALSDEILIAADSPAARPMAEAILSHLPKDSRCLWLPDAVAANVLRLDRTVIIQAGYPESEKSIRREAEALGLRVQGLDMSELVKADGALTCCSILIGD